MCEPVTIATLAIGAATAVYSHNQQVKAIEQATAAQQEQINAQAAQKTHERMQEARALRASARAAAAEAGVAGNSVDIFLNDIMGQAGQDVSLIETNRRAGVEASAAESRARSRAAQTQMYGQLAQTGLGAYSGYMDYKRYQIGDG